MKTMYEVMIERRERERRAWNIIGNASLVLCFVTITLAMMVA